MDTPVKATESPPCAALNLLIVPFSLRSSWPGPRRFGDNARYSSNCGSGRRWSGCFISNRKSRMRGGSRSLCGFLAGKTAWPQRVHHQFGRENQHPGTHSSPSAEAGAWAAVSIEFEYQRGGALQFLAAWDVRRGYVMGRCDATTGIDPFGRLVKQVMEQEPYRSAVRVFWVVDDGSSHRGEASIARSASSYPTGILVRTPVHASWLNPVAV